MANCPQVAHISPEFLWVHRYTHSLVHSTGTSYMTVDIPTPSVSYIRISKNYNVTLGKL